MTPSLWMCRLSNIAGISDTGMLLYQFFHECLAIWDKVMYIELHISLNYNILHLKIKIRKFILTEWLNNSWTFSKVVLTYVFYLLDFENETDPGVKPLKKG